MKAEGFHNPPLIWRLRTDLGETSGKNPSNGLVKLEQELVKFVNEISNKVHELKTYNKSVNNLIGRNKWQKAINKELRNLDTYQT